MNKKYISILILSAALFSAGCVREEIRNNANKGEVLVQISLDGFATKSVVGTEAENAVNHLDVIVFAKNGTQLYKWPRVSSPSLSGSYYEQSTTAETIAGSGNANDLKTAKTLAIANYPGAESDFSGKTLAQVLALAVTANNATPATGKFLQVQSDDTYQTLDSPSFVMASAVGSFKEESSQLISTVSLRRLAAKVTLTLNYAYDPNDSDPNNQAIMTSGTMGGHATTTVWVPMIGANTRVYLDNGALDATLNGLAADPGVFRYSDNHPSYDTNTTGAFYTYPLAWNAGSDRAPFIKIIQPWHYVTVDDDDPKHPILDENVVELYYKVMFPDITMLESNTWYHSTVTLDVLGGEADDPVELTGIGMDILDWCDVPSTGAGSLEDINLEPAKYLVPEFHEITVHNGHGAVINYIASSEPTLKVNAIYKDVYTNNGTQRKYIFDPSKSSSDYKDTDIIDSFAGINTVPDPDESAIGKIITPYSDSDGYWFQNYYDSGTGKGQIILHHTLTGEFFKDNGDPQPNFAARPYTYELTLSLAGVNPQAITIVQNPPLTVEGIKSTGWAVVNSVATNFGTTYRARESTDAALGYNSVFSSSDIFIYSRWYAYVSQGRILGSVSTYRYLAPTGNNNCRWMFLVHPSPEEGRYLQDPRIDIQTNNVVNTRTNHDSGDFGLYEIINQHAATSTANSGTEGPSLFKNGDSFGYPSRTLDATSYATEAGYLKKYRPTKKIARKADGTPADALPGTAPEFLVASSYGKSIALSYIGAVLRCAAYQEDGYPAGRWRVPTESEIELAVSLFRRGAIPSMFDGKYWASSGRYLSYSGSTLTWTQGTDDEITINSGSSAIGVRCVYDTWYWGRDEVDALKDGVYTEAGTNYQKYRWSGYQYSSK